MPYVHKVNVKYFDHDSGLSVMLPALYCDSGIVISHLRYLASYQHKSASWKERSVFSLKLLIKYINAVQSFERVTDLLRSFTQALVVGTIDYECFNDPAGLYWKARNITDANNILFHITQYTDYLAVQEGYEFSRINPFKKATNYEERLNWCAYYHKQANVFLNHLSKKSSAYIENRRVREINGYPAPKIEQEKVVKFPEAELDKLIHIGFSKSGVPDYKSQAITMLLNYGGLEKVKCFTCMYRILHCTQTELMKHWFAYITLNSVLHQIHHSRIEVYICRKRQNISQEPNIVYLNGFTQVGRARY